MTYPKIKRAETSDGILDREDATKLQAELLELFRSYDLHVAVGLTAQGIMIASQDARVNAETFKQPEDQVVVSMTGIITEP